MNAPRKQAILRNTMPWRIPRSLLITYLVLTLSGLGFFAWNFDSHVQDQYRRARTASTRLVAAYDRALAAHGDFLSAIAAQMSSELRVGGDSQGNVVRQLTVIGSRNLYTSQGSNGSDALPAGRVTGALPIPSPASAKAREIDAAMGLTPLCEAVLDRNPEMPWCYYVSANRFIYMFPFSSDPTAYYTDEILGAEFFQHAGPASNPTRAQVWSPVHWDIAGKGYVTTIAQPVYDGDTFSGVVAIDIQASTLLKLHSQFSAPDSSVRLYSGDGTAMVGRSLPITPTQWSALVAGSSVTVSGKHVIAQRIPASGWWLVTATDVQGARVAAIAAALPLSVIGLLVFISLALLAALARAWREVRELAVRDGLTKLFNRRQFDVVTDERMHRATRDAPHLGLAIMDVDNFKAYNDAYGHANGDAVLQAVAGAISGALRRADDTSFRIGGEEFAALIGVQDSSELERSLERVREAVQALGIEHAGTPAGVVTLSIGCTMVTPAKGTDVDAAYRTADAALYEAKEAGRNRVIMRNL